VFLDKNHRPTLVTDRDAGLMIQANECLPVGGKVVISSDEQENFAHLYSILDSSASEVKSDISNRIVRMFIWHI
jgi:hypothetical protein